MYTCGLRTKSEQQLEVNLVINFIFYCFSLKRLNKRSRGMRKPAKQDRKKRKKGDKGLRELEPSMLLAIGFNKLYMPSSLIACLAVDP